MLTRRLQRDPALDGVGLVVFDEFHERNLQTDLASPSRSMPAALRPDLRVLAMSATLDADRVAALLGARGPAPVVTSEGRAHPVDVRWAPRRPRERPRAGGRGRRSAGRCAPSPMATCSSSSPARPTSAAPRPSSATRSPPRRSTSARSSAPCRGRAGRRPRPGPPGRRGGAGHRHRRDEPDRRRRADRGRHRAGAAPRVRPPHRADAAGHRDRLEGLGRAARRPRRAAEPGRRLPPVVEGRAAPRRPFTAPEIPQVDLAGLALELAVWGTDPAELPFLDPPPARPSPRPGSPRALGALDADGRPPHRARAPMADLPSTPGSPAWSSAPGPGPGGGLRAGRAARGARRAARPPRRGADRCGERLRVVADPGPATRWPTGAVRRARPVGELARRAGIDRPRRVDPTACGPLLALAYPDRLAQARGGGRFLLRGGSGAGCPRPTRWPMRRTSSRPSSTAAGPGRRPDPHRRPPRRGRPPRRRRRRGRGGDPPPLGSRARRPAGPDRAERRPPAPRRSTSADPPRPRRRTPFSTASAPTASPRLPWTAAAALTLLQRAGFPRAVGGRRGAWPDLRMRPCGGASTPGRAVPRRRSWPVRSRPGRPPAACRGGPPWLARLDAVPRHGDRPVRPAGAHRYADGAPATPRPPVRAQELFGTPEPRRSTRAGSRCRSTCSRRPGATCRSPPTCPASGPARGPTSARTWPAATRSTTGPSTRAGRDRQSRTKVTFMWTRKLVTAPSVTSTFCSLT